MSAKAKKGVSKEELRRLMKQQKSEGTISHPLAKYPFPISLSYQDSKSFVLVCDTCTVVVIETNIRIYTVKTSRVIFRYLYLQLRVRNNNDDNLCKDA